MSVNHHCPRCSAACDEEAHFCPQCGWALHKPYYKMRWSAKSVAVVTILTLALWGAGFSLQTSKAGIRPTKSFEEAQGVPVAKAELEPEVARLKELAESHPGDLEQQKAYARSLLGQLRRTEEPAQNLMLEATDAFGTWIRLSPKDPEALIAMADLSFNAKVFDKAGDLYRRYLQEKPDDLAARARYASSLAFVGKPDDAIKELEGVLKKDPRNFHALAYLSIAYAQIGDAVHAREIGVKALEHAPSPEARARFQEFLDALEAEAKSPAAGPQVEDARGGVAALAQSISGNPVAGPKYVSFESPSAAELVVFFRNFPMQAMPPFAKEKFFASIREKARSLGLKDLKKITFVDADSKQALDSMTIE